MRTEKYQRCGACGLTWPTFKSGKPKAVCKNGHTHDRIKWTVRLVGSDGKKKTASFATETEADVYLAEIAMSKATTGAAVPPQRKPFAAYLDEWVDSRSSSLSDNSIAAYRRVGKKVSADPVGRIPISALTRSDLRAFYNRLLATELSVASINQVSAVVNGATSEAHASGHARINAGHKAWNPPKDRNESSQRAKAFTAPELKAVLETARGDDLWPLWRLIATTGVRRGEALGLRWDDVDLAAGTIAVRRNMVTAPADGSPPTTGSPKSGHSRIVAMDAVTVEALNAHKRSQNLRRIESYHWTDQGWVFDRGGGVAWNPSTISMRFKSLVDRAGVTRLGLHGLRHSAATTLISEGVPIEIVSKILGHSDVSITSSIYSHLTEDTLAAATAKIAEAIDG